MVRVRERLRRSRSNSFLARAGDEVASTCEKIMFLGLTQLSSSASERRVVCLPFDKLRTNGSMVLADRSVCGFSARSAEKPHTIEMERTALPKAEHANCVSPTFMD